MKRGYLFIVVFFTLISSAYAVAKIQVWDLGAEQFSTEQYQNMLSEAEINSWYTETPGTNSVTTGNITANDSCNFIFNAGGKNHRLRTTNTNLTRYDSKSKKDAAGNVYTGYIYSNSSSNTSVYIQQNYSQNDKVEFFVGSNGSAETYELAAPSGAKTQALFTNAAGIEKLTFYIGETGIHKLYGIDEKLVVARILRTPAQYVSLSGSVTAPAAIPADYKICFTNVQNGSSRMVTPVSNQYTVDSLVLGYKYKVSLVGANGFVVNSESPISITAAGQTANVEIKQVDLKTISGSISGLPADLLDKLEFRFEKPENAVYIPEILIVKNSTDTTYRFQVESGVQYILHVLNVNDYQFSEDTLITTSDIVNYPVYFTLKPTYAVTIVPTIATLADLTAAVFTFTNLKEEGYVYQFKGTDGIALRDGVYGVKVTNSGIYTQLLTSNLKINGAAANKTIDFISNITSWNFKETDYQTDYTNPAASYNYQGLTISGGKAHSGGGMVIKDGTIEIPVSGPCNIIVGTDYEWSYYFNKSDTIYEKSGSSSEKTTYTYAYSGASGFVKLTFTSACPSYLWSLEVQNVVDFSDTVTVGADKEYKTIGEALTAIQKMPRPDKQRVFVMIDPGNYEEMLKIEVDNVSLINASTMPSIAIKNAGVDIDENAVRITGYYGHGYNYYSMNSNYMWDARTLAVNKENGYTDMVNPGGGSTLWNSIVFVTAKGFEAENIIFENSYNQYISAKEASDVVVEIENAGKGTRPTEVGSTAVQARSFRERASALGFSKTADKAFLNNCRIIGRQDALYGDNGVRVACYKGVLMGACDYIFGGMNLTCYQTELAMNTTDDSNDVAYLTAAKQSSGERGYLFYQCHITSAVPNVETATTKPSKPGYFGRPWDANGETVFYQATIDTTACSGYSGSLIVPAGWNNGLVSSGSPYSVEYGTIEVSGNDNSANRVSWAKVLTTPVLEDGTAITCLNFTKGNDGWDPFAGKINSGIRNTSKETNAQVYVSNGEIYFNHVSGMANVQVFGMDGRLAKNMMAVSGDRTTIEDGLWLVKITDNNGAKAVKVLVK